jgi:hypothetical protein
MIEADIERGRRRHRFVEIPPVNANARQDGASRPRLFILPTLHSNGGARTGSRDRSVEPRRIFLVCR